MTEHREDHADRHGFTGPDELDVRTLARGGTPDGTKFLRDDGTWQTASGGGDTLWELIDDGGGVMKLHPIDDPDIFQVVTTNDDILLQSGDDILLQAAYGASVYALVGPILLNAADLVHLVSATLFQLDVNGISGVVGTDGAVLDLLPDDHVNVRAREASPTDGTIGTEEFALFMESSLIKARVRDSGGTLRTDTLTNVGGDLWTYSGGNLTPTTNPSGDFTVGGAGSGVGNSINLIAVEDVRLEAGDDVRINPEDDLWIGESGDPIDDLHILANGDLDAAFSGNVAITAATTGTRWDLVGREMLIRGSYPGVAVVIEASHVTDGEISLIATKAVNVTNPEQFNVTVSQDISLSAGRDLLIGNTSTDQVDIWTGPSAPTDARMMLGSIVPYLDETNNVIKFRVRESGGSYFTGEVPYF